MISAESRFIAAVAALVLVLTACADDGPRPIAAAPQQAEAPPPTAGEDDPVAVPVRTVIVESIDNTFKPQVVEVEPGTEIVWVNMGHNEHDILSESGFGIDAAHFHPGSEYRHVFTEPGEYRFHCTIHGTHDIGMTGTIVVSAV